MIKFLIQRINEVIELHLIIKEKIEFLTPEEFLLFPDTIKSKYDRCKVFRILIIKKVEEFPKNNYTTGKDYKFLKNKILSLETFSTDQKQQKKSNP